MAGQRIHFNLPTSLQRFPNFAKLPWDVRRIIWEMAIYTPGMHFLKFERNASFQDEDDDETPTTQLSSYLRPAFKSSRGDRSWYVYRNKDLDALAESCNEARHLVSKARNNTSNLRLDTAAFQDSSQDKIPSHSIVSLGAADDIICLDYPNMGQAGSHLGDWAQRLDQKQLANIRNLAVRYHITWGEDTRTCHSCGRVHDSRRRIPKLPPHLHQFPELFPNLEHFYLIDSFAVLRTTGTEDGIKKRGDRFAFGEGRCCFEIDSSSAVLNHNARNTLNWIEGNYNSMVMKKRDNALIAAGTEDISGTKPNEARRVEFKILASGWDLSQTTIPEPSAVSQSRRTLAKSKRSSRSYTAEKLRLLKDKHRDCGHSLNRIYSPMVMEGRQISIRRDSTASTVSNMSSASDSSTVSTASTATSVGDHAIDLTGTMDRLSLKGIKGVYQDLHQNEYGLSDSSFTFGDNEAFLYALKIKDIWKLKF